ncbi:MAG TPA: hypothetical protein VGK99_06430 [Acidobacteriota bacterium]|jgi:hypothetical protein
MHFTRLSEINDSLNQINLKLGQLAGTGADPTLESIYGHLSSIQNRLNAGANVKNEFGCGVMWPRIPELTQK